MTDAETKSKSARHLTNDELALLIKLFRESRQWSQEQLSEISRLSTRTIQRVEEGLPCSLDTRRALASALGFEDIDALNKPYCIPTDEQIAEEKKQFDKKNITLKATLIDSGKTLGKLMEHTSASMFSEAIDLPQEAGEVFAFLTDFSREYMDFDDLYSEIEKRTIYAELDESLKKLNKLGFSLVSAYREATLKMNNNGANIKMNIAYIVAFPKGQEVENIAVPRKIGFGL